MADFLLSSSILSADFGRLANQIREAEQAGVDFIHIDVMDGCFVPNITMGPFIVETCKRLTNLPLDVHLMICHPERHIHSFIVAGADYLSVHIENNPNINRTINEIREGNCLPGIVLNPATPASAIEEVIDIVEFVLVMTVNPGYSGQVFMPETCRKVQKVAALIKERKSQARIEVDGGITATTLPSAYHAGARIFVAATAIFKHPQGIAAGVQELRSSIP